MQFGFDIDAILDERNRGCTGQAGSDQIYAVDAFDNLAAQYQIIGAIFIVVRLAQDLRRSKPPPSQRIAVDLETVVAYGLVIRTTNDADFGTGFG